MLSFSIDGWLQIPRRFLEGTAWSVVPYLNEGHHEGF